MNKIAAINIRALNVTYYTYLIHTRFFFKLFLLYFIEVFSRGIKSVSFTWVVFAQSKVILSFTHMEINLLFKCSFFNHITLDLNPNYIFLSLISSTSQVF